MMIYLCTVPATKRAVNQLARLEAGQVVSLMLVADVVVDDVDEEEVGREYFIDACSCNVKASCCPYLN